MSRQDSELPKLTEFRVLAIPRLAAQHDEIERLRSQLTRQTEAGDVVTRLTLREAPFGSCSLLRPIPKLLAGALNEFMDSEPFPTPR